MPDLSAFLNSINKTKVNLMRSGSDEENAKAIADYPAYMVRKIMSQFADTIFDANEMNCLASLDNQMQYEYFLSAIPKKSRFSQMPKVPKQENVELLKSYYSYSTQKVMEIIDLFNDDAIEQIKHAMSEGGIVKK